MRTQRVRALAHHGAIRKKGLLRCEKGVVQNLAKWCSHLAVKTTLRTLFPRPAAFGPLGLSEVDEGFTASRYTRDVKHVEYFCNSIYNWQMIRMR